MSKKNQLAKSTHSTPADINSIRKLFEKDVRDRKYDELWFWLFPMVMMIGVIGYYVVCRKEMSKNV